MRLFVSCAFLFLIISGGSAWPQQIVVGESAAAACYHSAIARISHYAALSDCNVALQRDRMNRRDRAATHVNRGILFMHRGRSDAALLDFDRAEQLRPDYAVAVAVNRSAALIRLSRYEESLRYSDLALANKAETEYLADAWFSRAVALESLGRFALARDAYLNALEARPNWLAPERELRRCSLHPTR
jgi:tetratricopeptide (TPR) repeat protein